MLGLGFFRHFFTAILFRWHLLTRSSRQALASLGSETGVAKAEFDGTGSAEAAGIGARSAEAEGTGARSAEAAGTGVRGSEAQGSGVGGNASWK